MHPSEKNDVHEFYLICADVDAFVARVTARGLSCSPVRDMGWGRLTQVSLPGAASSASTSRGTRAPKPVAVARPEKKPARRAPARRKVKARAPTRGARDETRDRDGSRWALVGSFALGRATSGQVRPESTPLTSTGPSKSRTAALFDAYNRCDLDRFKSVSSRRT